MKNVVRNTFIDAVQPSADEHKRSHSCGLRDALRHKYDVEWHAVLGKGTYGTTVAAVHKPSSDRVAIKYMNEGAEREVFLHEIRMLKTLGTHPNCIMLWDRWPREICSPVQIFH